MNFGAGMINPRSFLKELQVEDIHGLGSQFYFQVKKKKSDENFFSLVHKETLGLMASKKYIFCFMHVFCKTVIECEELCKLSNDLINNVNL